MIHIRLYGPTALCLLLSACQTSPSVEATHARVSAHYTAVGSVGTASAFVYADKTVIELEEPADTAVATDGQGKPFRTSVEGRFVRLETVAREVRLHIGARNVLFVLDPAAKIYGSHGVVLTQAP